MKCPVSRCTRLPTVLSSDAEKTFLINTHERQRMSAQVKERQKEFRKKKKDRIRGRNWRRKVIKTNYFQSWCRNKINERKKREGEGESFGYQWGLVENKLKCEWNDSFIIGRRGQMCVCVIHLHVCVVYLRKPSLAVHNIVPVFAVQAVRQFVLPDKCSVLGAGAALQASCTLGNNATYHLGRTEIHLKSGKSYLIFKIVRRRRF